MKTPLSWESFLKLILENPVAFDECRMQIGDSLGTVPKIIKATITLLDQMIDQDSIKNVIILPESKYLPKLISIFWYLLLIMKGSVFSLYDPRDFKEGEILRLGKSRVKVKGYDEKNRLIVNTRDETIYAIPLEILPVLQRTKTSTLTSSKIFQREREIYENKVLNSDMENQSFINNIKKFRTHMSQAIIHVGKTTNFSDIIDDMKISESGLTDLLMFEKINSDGSAKYLGNKITGGNPSIINAPNLYAANRHYSKKNGNVEKIFFEAANSNDVINQLGSLDDITRQSIKLTVLIDNKESSCISYLLDRKFQIWAWDEVSLSKDLYNDEFSQISNKLKNAVEKEIMSVIVSSEFTNPMYECFKKFGKEAKSYAKTMSELYFQISSTFFELTRTTIPLENKEIKQLNSQFVKMKENLENEKPFLAEDKYIIFKKAIDGLINFTKFDLLNKHNAIEKLLESVRPNTKICIVLPEKASLSHVKKYWIADREYIEVLSAKDFYDNYHSGYKICIIVGWIGKEVMKKIFYSNNSKQYYILLFKHEAGWKNQSFRHWDKDWSNYGLNDTVKNLFSFGGKKVSIEKFVSKNDCPLESDIEPDEIDDFEANFADFKFNAIIGQAKQGDKSGLLVNAFPIIFSNDEKGVFTETHKLTSVTGLVLSESKQPKRLVPSQLKTGDYVVFRDSDKDLLKEIADNLLERAGYGHLRKFSGRWYEPLQKFYIKHEFSCVTKRLRKAGCNVTTPTIRNWIFEETIVPENAESILQIGTAFEDKYLIENYENIFIAGKNVQNAHIRAGRILTEKLRIHLPGEIENLIESVGMDNICGEPFNIEEVGNIKILKVIKISQSREVDDSLVNKLL